jgi:hypothetical protein
VAEAALSVYNSGILKHYLSIKPATFTSLVAGFLLAITLIGGTSFAQSPVQNTNTTNGLQPQASSTQQSASTQNQVGTLQNNDGGTVLNQAGNKSLGVVSSPNQTTPEAVVAPSKTTKADITAIPKTSKAPFILWVVGILFAAGIGVLIFRSYRGDQPLQNNLKSDVSTEKSPTQPETQRAKLPKDRKQQRRKKKKRSNQR